MLFNVDFVTIISFQYIINCLINVSLYIKLVFIASIVISFDATHCKGPT